MGEPEQKKDEGQKQEPQKKGSSHPILRLFLLAGLAGAGYYLYTHYRLERQDGRVVVSWKEQTSDAAGPSVQAVSVSGTQTDRPYIRIATVNLDPGQGRRTGREYPVELLSESLREFDLIALQGIRAEHHRFLLDLVEWMNRKAPLFDFAVDSEVSQGGIPRYNAFIFQTRTIETDLRNLFTVDIADKGFRYRPLIGHFRVRGPQPADAFTFCLINAYIPMDCLEDNQIPVSETREALREMDTMVEVFKTAEKAVPKEDDVIIVGGLTMSPWYGSGVSGFDKWDPEVLDASVKKGLIIPNLDRTLSLSTARSVAVGNFFLRRKATVEYTGRSDVEDLPPSEEGSARIRQFAWAEFYSREGAPRVAAGANHPR